MKKFYLWDGFCWLPISGLSGKAQVIIRSVEGRKGDVRMTVSGNGLKEAVQQFTIN